MSVDINLIKQQKRNTSQKIVNSKKEMPFWKKDLSFGKALNDRYKEAFYSELVILLTSGLDFKSSLDILVNEEKKEKIKSILKGVSDKIIHGKSFSEAIKDNKEFSVYEYFSLRIGEESGKMQSVLEELAAYFGKKVKQRKQVISAISYPVMIFVTALGAVFFMLNFIVPLFADAFKRFNSDLPSLTKAVIYLSGIFRQQWFIIPCVIISIFVFYRLFRKKEWYRSTASKILLKTPIFGKLMQKIYLASFCQSMSLMTGAKTPLIQSLDLVSKMIKLYPMQKALLSIKEDLYHGIPLNEAMAKFKIFESRMVTLIKVGEETNRLDSIFNRLYNQYSEETDHQTAIMSSMLEPFLIIVVGGMVALILVAMYLPMFKLGSSLMG